MSQKTLKNGCIRNKHKNRLYKKAMLKVTNQNPVIHIDGDPGNNTLSNLIIVPSKLK